MIAYGSVYGHTENLANVLAGKLADLGVKDVRMYDVSATHPSYILAEAFPLQPSGVRVHYLQWRASSPTWSTCCWS